MRVPSPLIAKCAMSRAPANETFVLSPRQNYFERPPGQACILLMATSPTQEVLQAFRIREQPNTAKCVNDGFNRNDRGPSSCFDHRLCFKGRQGAERHDAGFRARPVSFGLGFGRIGFSRSESRSGIQAATTTQWYVVGVDYFWVESNLFSAAKATSNHFCRRCDDDPRLGIYIHCE